MPRARSPKPIPPTPRTTTRIERVEELLLAGTRSTTLVAMVTEEHDVSERQVFADIAAVRDRWAAESEATRPQKRAEMLAQVEDLYGRCIAAGDLPVAVQTLRLKADLHGARVRPMAALVQPGAAPASVDAWLSSVLGFTSPSTVATPEGDGRAGGDG
jgi:hypothetical protein